LLYLVTENHELIGKTYITELTAEKKENIKKLKINLKKIFSA